MSYARVHTCVLQARVKISKKETIYYDNYDRRGCILMVYFVKNHEIKYPPKI